MASAVSGFRQYFVAGPGRLEKPGIQCFGTITFSMTQRIDSVKGPQYVKCFANGLY